MADGSGYLESAAGRDINKLHGTLCPLSYAVRTGKQKFVHMLISLGASGDIVNSDQSTPFIDLINVSDEEASITLIENGLATPNRPYDRGWTPFCMAARKRLSKLCMTMLKHGVKLCCDSLLSRNGLHEACMMGLSDVCRAIILGDESLINVQDKRGNTPLHECIRNYKGSCHDEICYNLIMAGANTNTCNIWGLTPLMQAAKDNNIPILKMLITAGANINFTGPSGQNALYYCIFKPSLEAAHILLETGIDIDYQNQKGRTVLQEAILARSFEFAQCLLQYVPDLDLIDCFEDTAIVNSIQTDFRHWDIYLTIGFDIHYTTSYGETLLHIAASQSNTDTAIYWCSRLLESGVDPFAETKSGLMAIDLCEPNSNAQRLLSRYMTD